ncbi:MAG: phosphoketolase family protein [Bacilli bacterium]|nr:phosphoketolase family protein [Bacilli bacterium]MBP3635610.1 phosphoketolase family protein [Bacilli bacterium]
MKRTLSDKELNNINAYFRAANYLSACQLYLLDNPLLDRKLELKDIKPNVVGHWGTVPGQNFIYVHLNRIIKKYDLNMMYISGPGHGGNAIVANSYLEGTYSEVYPNITEDKEGMKKLFKQFSFPGGVSSHVAPETPGSINEGGELGYSLSHAFGAVLDNPNLIATCVVGDGEAETGPLSTSWHLNKFLNPKTDGIVLPILHLNGYKIANPTVFSRISNEEIDNFFKGCGWDPYYVEGDDPFEMHEKMATVLDEVVQKLQIIKTDAKNNSRVRRPMWPMIVLRTPKGWTGPKEVEEKQIEGSFRAHQVPIVVNNENEKNLPLLESWLRSYKPEELFDKNGKLIKKLKDLAPTGNRRMSANVSANGGELLKELRLPDFRKYAVEFDTPGSVVKQDMIELSKYIRDLIYLNKDNRNFRVFGPDEALSNRLNAIFEETNRQWVNKTYENDEYLSSDGRVIDSYLSEHFCEGALEGYLLTGRHGFIHTYEAFARIIDSMVSQHAKWLKVTKELPWREDISSLNIILSSHIWQQDHNGYTHQDPGFLNHLVTKKADIVRMYLPPDANCLISCFDHVIKTKNYINVIVASKHPRYQWLSMDDAIKHCTKGIGIWQWASNDGGKEPDIVLACAGDTPTLEVLAATQILNENFPKLKVRVVNVVDLMRLESNDKHPHGLTDKDYDAIFTKNKPIIFAFHGYPSLIHQLTYNRQNKNMHVHGYQEEGTITTPFDMRVQNKIDRFNLVIDALKYLPKLEDKSSELIEWCKNKLVEHKEYIREYGKDMDIVLNFKWGKEDI